MEKIPQKIWEKFGKKFAKKIWEQNWKIFWEKLGKKSNDFPRQYGNFFFSPDFFNIFLKIALMEVTKAGAIQNMIPMLPKLVITPTVLCPIVFAPLMEH